MYRYIQSTVSSATSVVYIIGAPIVNSAYSTVVPPLPPVCAEEKLSWRHIYPTRCFMENNAVDLFTLFANPEEKKKVGERQVLCAVHYPGRGLDLIVIHNIKSKYDQAVKDNYFKSWTGGERDRLFETICNFIAYEPSYETLIRRGLDSPESLLYQVLHDHRYSYSPSALSGNRPDTLTLVNKLLRDLEKQRINENIRGSTSANQNKV